MTLWYDASIGGVVVLLGIHKRILELLISTGKSTDCTVITSAYAPSKGTFGVRDIADHLGVKPSSVVVALRDLERMRYVEELLYNNRMVGYRLSLLGESWRKERAHQVGFYVLDKWIDFFALVIALLALVCTATGFKLPFLPQP